MNQQDKQAREWIMVKENEKYHKDEKDDETSHGPFQEPLIGAADTVGEGDAGVDVDRSRAAVDRYQGRWEASASTRPTSLPATAER